MLLNVLSECFMPRVDGCFLVLWFVWETTCNYPKSSSGSYVKQRPVIEKTERSRCLHCESLTSNCKPKLCALLSCFYIAPFSLTNEVNALWIFFFQEWWWKLRGVGWLLCALFGIRVNKQYIMDLYRAIFLLSFYSV